MSLQEVWGTFSQIYLETCFYWGSPRLVLLRACSANCQLLRTAVQDGPHRTGGCDTCHPRKGVCPDHSLIPCPPHWSQLFSQIWKQHQSLINTGIQTAWPSDQTQHMDEIYLLSWYLFSLKTECCGEQRDHIWPGGMMVLAIPTENLGKRGWDRRAGVHFQRWESGATVNRISWPGRIRASPSLEA